jgi:hypothetical protein
MCYGNSDSKLVVFSDAYLNLRPIFRHTLEVKAKFVASGLLLGSASVESSLELKDALPCRIYEMAPVVVSGLALYLVATPEYTPVLICQDILIDEFKARLHVICDCLCFEKFA